MPNYKDTENKLHFIEAEFEHLLPAGCVEITDEEAEALRPVPVPAPIVVSPRQFKQALDLTVLPGDVNLYDAVEAAIAASASRQLTLWWVEATSFEENHPIVLSMSNQLGQTTEQTHNLFVLAASL